MREITDHYDGHGLTESLQVEADGPGPGGASHLYVVITRPDASGNGTEVARIQFQKGPRNEAGSITGVVESVLLGIVADRMKAFQAGPYGCRENALVLTKIDEAMHWLKHRADERAKRGVLGTNQK